MLGAVVPVILCCVCEGESCACRLAPSLRTMTAVARNVPPLNLCVPWQDALGYTLRHFVTSCIAVKLGLSSSSSVFPP